MASGIFGLVTLTECTRRPGAISVRSAYMTEMNVNIVLQLRKKIKIQEKTSTLIAQSSNEI